MTTTQTKIQATIRERSGKGAARETRREGRIPAVIYGGKEKPVMISLEARTFLPVSQKSGFFTHLVEIEAGGKAIRVLPRDVQFDPVSDFPVHVDFLRVSANSRVRVFIPVVFVAQDKSPGLKRGGAINVAQHQLLLSCSPERIPEKIEVSVEGLNIGDTIHIEDITLPEDTKSLLSSHSDTTIASIAAPTTVKEEVAPTAAAAPADGAAAPAAGAAAPAAGAAAAPAAGAAAPAKK
jgi:large subunit ribosomal protein L25